MSIVIAVLIALGVIWFVWRFMALLHPSQPAEPVDDPSAFVPAPRKGHPKGGSGAIALEEPDDEGPADCYPPRTL